jgi:hypothetical protein
MHYSDIFVIAGKIVNNVEKDIKHNGIISLIY